MSSAPTMQQIGEAAQAVLAIQQGRACAFNPEKAGSASPVGGESAASLPKLTDETWEVLCHTHHEKRALFDFAEKCGLAKNTDDSDYQSHDLLVGVLDGVLVSYDGPDHEEINYGLGRRLLSLADFRAMCEIHAGWPA